MLKTLKIKNVALIDEASIIFDKNLNIISGETGAGKSIVLDCISLILGMRADKSLIRSNAEFLRVDATIVEINENAVNYLKELDFDADDCLMISRKISVDGKNEIRLNGEIIPLSVLKKLASFLIATHSQNENLSLLNNSEQLNLIDVYSKLENKLCENAEIYNNLKNLNSKIDELNKDDDKRFRELDLLNYQIDEIENASLKENEETNLKEELLTLKNFEKIKDIISEINALYKGDYNSSGLNSLMFSFKNALNNLTDFNSKINDLKTRFDSAYYEIEDIFNEISGTFNLEDFSENRLEEIENRLEVYKKMRAKYGNSLDEIFKFLADAKHKRDYIENYEENLKILLKQKDDILNLAYKKALEISKIRRENAKNLQNLILNEVKELSMPNAQLVFQFNEIPSRENFDSTYSKSGFDSVNILFSANLGESLKPLNQIVSGGELSRLMLSIKTICAQNFSIQTLIFDEIDTGVSGNAGLNISKKLAKISQNRQVIAVSHLFQICAMADKNILVKKIEENGHTSTKILELTTESDQITELSRFLSATQITNATIENAKEVKTWCNNFKKSL